MYFRILHDPDAGELSYLLADLDAGEAVLIDPRSADLPVLRALLAERDLRLCWVLRTHHHDEQCPGELSRLALLGAPVVQGQAAVGARAGIEGEVLPFGSELVRVLATPGHTGFCLSFVWRDRVFCGGLLAPQACAHQPRPASAHALWDSVTARLFALPDETLLFSGQMDSGRGVSTVLEQRRGNRHFAGGSRDSFLARMTEQAKEIDYSE